MESLQQDMMNAENIKNKFFHEEFDLDAVENVAKITVPDFRDGRSGRFLHDFQNNETAIIDQEARRCFVMPLDREHILPPQSLTDLIQKMYRGYYEIDTTVIRKTMRVVTPAVDDMSLISPKIQDACRNKNVYRLEKYVEGGECQLCQYCDYNIWDGITVIDGFCFLFQWSNAALTTPPPHTVSSRAKGSTTISQILEMRKSTNANANKMRKCNGKMHILPQFRRTWSLYFYLQ